MDSLVMNQFIVNQCIQSGVLFLTAYGGGQLVIKKGVRVNYTRKINHFMLFISPMFLNRILSYEYTLVTLIASFLIGVLTLGVYIKPIREKYGFIATMFASFDRPEDRPNTLLWVSTQIIVAGFILIPMIVYFFTIGKLDLVFIPLLINGLGDGLAEPVGVAFGKHKYTVRALFSDKRYERSLEGSFCVFVVSVLSIILMMGNFTHHQFIVALAVIPVVMTLAEALSPHTWDSPFLFGVCGLALYFILQI